MVLFLFLLQRKVTIDAASGAATGHGNASR